MAVIEGVVLLKNENLQVNRKTVIQQAVAVTQLPDLALTTQATWLRHRSLATPFAIFPEDGSLLDYFPASFVYTIAVHQSEPGVSKHEY